MQPQHLFARHPLFAALSSEEASELLKRAPIKRFVAGQVVFRKGDPGDGLYGVLSGSILIVAESLEGRELILNKHGRAEIFGEVALLDGKGRSATAVAYEASELCHVSRDKLVAFLRMRPEAMVRIVGFLCARLRRVTDLVEDAAFLNVPTRLAKQILTLRDAGGTPTTPAITLCISQNDLARMLGVSREFVGKQLVAWREAGIVELGRRRLTIRDAAALERLAVQERISPV